MTTAKRQLGDYPGLPKGQPCGIESKDPNAACRGLCRAGEVHVALVAASVEIGAVCQSVTIRPETISMDFDSPVDEDAIDDVLAVWT